MAVLWFNFYLWLKFFQTSSLFFKPVHFFHTRLIFSNQFNFNKLFLINCLKKGFSFFWGCDKKIGAWFFGVFSKRMCKKECIKNVAFLPLPCLFTSLSFHTISSPPTYPQQISMWLPSRPSMPSPPRHTPYSLITNSFFFFTYSPGFELTISDSEVLGLLNWATQASDANFPIFLVIISFWSQAPLRQKLNLFVHAHNGLMPCAHKMADLRERNCVNEAEFYRQIEQLKSQQKTNDSRITCYLEDDLYDKAKHFLKSWKNGKTTRAIRKRASIQAKRRTELIKMGTADDNSKEMGLQQWRTLHRKQQDSCSKMRTVSSFVPCTQSNFPQRKANYRKVASRELCRNQPKSC